MSYLRVEFHVFHPSPSPESGKGFLAAGFLLRRNPAIRLLPVRDFCSGAYTPSLQLLTEVKAAGGIFFPGYWLAGSLQFHVTRNVRAIVDGYLRTDANLQPGLKLKVLQAADMLIRFTDMSNGR